MLTITLYCIRIATDPIQNIVPGHSSIRRKPNIETKLVSTKIETQSTTEVNKEWLWNKKLFIYNHQISLCFVCCCCFAQFISILPILLLFALKIFSSLFVPIFNPPYHSIAYSIITKKNLLAQFSPWTAVVYAASIAALEVIPLQIPKPSNPEGKLRAAKKILQIFSLFILVALAFAFMLGAKCGSIIEPCTECQECQECQPHPPLDQEYAELWRSSQHQLFLLTDILGL